MENQILKSGFTSCELIILENDDPGGVFEFSSSSRGPYSIKVSFKVISNVRGGHLTLTVYLSTGKLLYLLFFF